MQIIFIMFEIKQFLFSSNHGRDENERHWRGQARSQSSGKEIHIYTFLNLRFCFRPTFENESFVSIFSSYLTYNRVFLLNSNIKSAEVKIINY